MNTQQYRRFSLGLLVAAVVAMQPSTAVAQSDEELLDAARTALKTERKAAVEEAMQFTEAEAKAFWPVYQQYRAETDKIAVRIQTLVIAYSSAYPEVTSENAKNGLKEVLALEKQQTAVRATYLGKIGKVLSPVKTFRFAQVDTRLDLANRLKLAANVPLVPIEGKIGLKTSVDTFHKPGDANSVTVTTVELKATVLAVDRAARQVTLLGKDGIKETITVGPDVVNFDQVKVGDEILMLLSDSLVVQMGDKTAGDRPDEVITLAPVGAKPGGVVASTTEAVVTVVAIDVAKRTVTLKLVDGTEKTFPVRPDLDLIKYHVGDKVTIRKTEAVALRITNG